MKRLKLRVVMCLIIGWLTLAPFANQAKVVVQHNQTGPTLLKASIIVRAKSSAAILESAGGG